MAHMNQERKAILQAALKKVVPEGWKYTLAVRNHSTIVFTLKQAPVDILGNIRQTVALKSFSDKNVEVGQYWNVNVYSLSNQFSGELLGIMKLIDAALNLGNHDNSDIQTDYFDVGWYVDINIGLWNDPFLDTVPVEQRVKKSTWKLSKPAKLFAKPAKTARAELVPYLPLDWASMTPGKKAHATKVAMQKYQEAQAA